MDWRRLEGLLILTRLGSETWSIVILKKTKSPSIAKPLVGTSNGTEISPIGNLIVMTSYPLSPDAPYPLLAVTFCHNKTVDKIWNTYVPVANRSVTIKRMVIVVDDGLLRNSKGRTGSPLSVPLKDTVTSTKESKISTYNLNSSNKNVVNLQGYNYVVTLKKKW